MQTINHPQDLVEVTAGGGGIGQGQTDFLGGIDDENAADGDLRVGIGVDHAVEVRHFVIHISQDGIVHRGALGLFDVLGPTLVVFHTVDAQGNGLNVALGEFILQLGNTTQLGGAHRGVVGGVGEQHNPAIASPFVEAQLAVFAALGEVLGEVRSDLT